MIEEHKAVFPLNLNTSGSKYYRAVTLAQLEQSTRTTVGFKTAQQIAHWLLRHGPVRLRARWHRGMVPAHPSARVDVVGEKRGRQTVVIMGYDSGEEYPFRVLTSFGSGFGQLGRVWLSVDGITKLLNEGAQVDAPWL